MFQVSATLYKVATPLEAQVLLAKLRKGGVLLFPYAQAVGFVCPAKANTPQVRDLIHRNQEMLLPLLVQERIELRDRLPSDEEPHGWILRRGKHPFPAMLACGSSAWCDAVMKSTALLQAPARDLWVRLKHEDVGHLIKDDGDRYMAPSIKIPGEERVCFACSVVSACRLCIVELIWKEPEVSEEAK